MNARESIARIEETLATDIPEGAALKRDLNKMVLALTDSIKQLVSVAKETVDALDVLQNAKPVVAPKPKAKSKTVRKPSATKINLEEK